MHRSGHRAVWPECAEESAIIFLRRRDLSARARHIRVHLGFVYDAIDSGCFHFRYVRSKQNPANSLTARRRLEVVATTSPKATSSPSRGVATTSPKATSSSYPSFV